jgi:hypothetical protein
MYTPQFSDTATITVRRLAWALGLSMPKAVDRMVSLLPATFNVKKVCAKCQDKTKCALCAFGQELTPEKKKELKKIG